MAHFSSEADCPWDTIAVVPTTSVEEQTTGLESAQVHVTPNSDHIGNLDERVRKPLEEKDIGRELGVPVR